MLPDAFFDRDAQRVARALVGKVLRRRLDGLWLAAQIVEVEAYYARERGSHAWLGRTPSRESLFQPPGTLYLYYSRGGDSLNVSCRGAGNAVLVKAGRPYLDARSPAESLARMHALNPGPRGARPTERLCAGQTLLCRALALRVPEWDGRRFSRRSFYVEDVGYRPRELVQTTRLGIPAGRDEHLPYRFVDAAFLAAATSRPARRRTSVSARAARAKGTRRARDCAEPVTSSPESPRGSGRIATEPPIWESQRRLETPKLVLFPPGSRVAPAPGTLPRSDLARPSFALTEPGRHPRLGRIPRQSSVETPTWGMPGPTSSGTLPG